MAQGQFTHEEAKRVREAVEEMFKALTKSKQMQYVGHFNDIDLFLAAAQKIAPFEQTEPKPEPKIETAKPPETTA
jgi:hypothetical protein